MRRLCTALALALLSSGPVVANNGGYSGTGTASATTPSATCDGALAATLTSRAAGDWDATFALSSADAPACNVADATTSGAPTNGYNGLRAAYRRADGCFVRWAIDGFATGLDPGWTFSQGGVAAFAYDVTECAAAILVRGNVTFAGSETGIAG